MWQKGFEWKRKVFLWNWLMKWWWTEVGDRFIDEENHSLVCWADLVYCEFLVLKATEKRQNVLSVSFVYEWPVSGSFFCCCTQQLLHCLTDKISVQHQYVCVFSFSNSDFIRLLWFVVRCKFVHCKDGLWVVPSEDRGYSKSLLNSG